MFRHPTRAFVLSLDKRCKRFLSDGAVQIAAIADGETCVRYWTPHLMHGTKAAALKRINERFPCVHRIVPVDPQTNMPVGRPRWTVSCCKIDWARYAVDYAQPQEPTPVPSTPPVPVSPSGVLEALEERKAAARALVHRISRFGRDTINPDDLPTIVAALSTYEPS